MSPLLHRSRKKNDEDAGDKNNITAELAEQIARLNLGFEPRTRPQRQSGGFVGGFDVERPTPNPNSNFYPARNSYENDGPSPAFPQPNTYHASPGPLPTPPMYMPVPRTDGRPQLSVTMQHALLPTSAGSQTQGGLRPPEAQLPPRPYSDPGKANPSESISARLPSTPAGRSSGGKSQTPSSVPAKQPRKKLPGDVQTTTPGKRRRAVSTPTSPTTSSTGIPDGKVQCSGMTKIGERCSRRITPSFTCDPTVEGEVEHYCHQHENQVLGPSGFYTKKTDSEVAEWIKFEDWIPEYLQKNTRAALRAEMEKPASKHDRDGYIYTFEIRDENNPGEIHLKIGRAVSLVKRIDEWTKQCGSKEQVLRGYWPGGLEDDDGPLMRGRVKAGPQGPLCHRLERLVHIEIADLIMNTPYLHPQFPNVDAESVKSDKKRTVKKKCPDCGTLHQEIFTFKRATQGRYRGNEWEKLVKPVIEKWGAFVEAYV